jgi:hypothetical protein
MDEDFAVSRPLVRPGLPPIRFLFVRSRLCSTLPSDPASQRRPCASLALHLHQVVQGTCTPKLSNMLGTQLNRFAVGIMKAAHPRVGARWPLLAPPRLRPLPSYSIPYKAKAVPTRLSSTGLYPAGRSWPGGRRSRTSARRIQPSSFSSRVRAFVHWRDIAFFGRES